jgi:hypothetical protein
MLIFILKIIKMRTGMLFAKVKESAIVFRGACPGMQPGVNRTPENSGHFQSMGG